MKRPGVMLVASIAGLLAAVLVLVFSPRATDKPAAQDGFNRRAGPRGSRVHNPVAIPTDHPRVVALAPAPARMLRDLGCAHLLVGRHAFDAWSDPALPVCGDQAGIDYERLIELSPTHVLLQWGERDLPQRLTTLAAERGWSVINLPLLTLSDIEEAVVRLREGVVSQEIQARRFDRQTGMVSTPRTRSEVESLASSHKRLIANFENALVHDETLATVGPVLLLYQGTGELTAGGTSRPAALGPGSYHHDILLRIGAFSAITTGKPFMTLDAEDVAALKPHAIVIVRPRPAATGQPAAPVTPRSVEDLRALLGPLGKLDLPALRTGRVGLIDDEMALVPATNLADFADDLRALLRGWAGADRGSKEATWPPK